MDDQISNYISGLFDRAEVDQGVEEEIKQKEQVLDYIGGLFDLAEEAAPAPAPAPVRRVEKKVMGKKFMGRAYYFLTNSPGLPDTSQVITYEETVNLLREISEEKIDEIAQNSERRSSLNLKIELSFIPVLIKACLGMKENARLANGRSQHIVVTYVKESGEEVSKEVVRLEFTTLLDLTFKI